MRQFCALGSALLLAAVAGGAFADTVAGAVVDAPGAEVRGLDKMASATRDLTIRNGATEGYGDMQVSVSDCRFPKDSAATDAWAHLTITSGKGDTLFSGWMSAASPGLSALDDPRYDVWLIRCINN